jgi:hypothetical protein
MKPSPGLQQCLSRCGLGGAAGLVLVAAMLAGCASDTRKSGGNYLATIRIEKKAATSIEDCAVAVEINNRMRDDWDAASYHVALLNKKGVAIGKLIGVPRHYTKSGQYLADSGKVLGAKCQDIAGVSLIYFGYYPTGRKQMPLHNGQVGVTLK